MCLRHILVAEDEAHIRLGLVTTLESEGYQVDAVADGRAALEKARSGGYDLIVLDVMMPELSGYDVCREIRGQDSHTPILMLTAKAEEIDKVVGLRLGADDYVTKPFGIHELLARVEALLRRSRLNTTKEPTTDRPDFDFGPWRVEPKRLCAVQGKRQVNLSARELKLLQLFAQHPGEVLDRDHLLREVWGIEYMGTTRTLDQHIAQLRKKVEEDTTRPDLIMTVHGVGYRH